MNLLPLLITLALAAEPTLKPEDGPANYGLCLDTARAYPQQGLELADRWDGLGGGEPAKHCRGVALIGLRRYAEAAHTLEAAAINSKQTAEVRAGLLAQAGQAWLLGGDAEHAREAQTAAIKLLPPGSRASVPILIDRAMSFADSKQYAEAIPDLTAALAIVPGNVDALAYRASAERQVGQLDAAAKDAGAAVAADATNLNALLERGLVARLQNRDAAARADWETVIALAPESAEASAARSQIAQLDVKPEPEKKSKAKRR